MKAQIGKFTLSLGGIIVPSLTDSVGCHRECHYRTLVWARTGVQSDWRTFS